MLKRQESMDQQKGLVTKAKDDPVAAIKEAQNIPNLDQTQPSWSKQPDAIIPGSDGDDGQVPWFNDLGATFDSTPQVDQQGGHWTHLPSTFNNFELVEDLAVTNDSVKDRDGNDANPVQPYYRTVGIDPKIVKRAIIVFPGKPRDSWKYATLFNNALNVMYKRNPDTIKEGDVMILAPAVLNMDDQEAGGVSSNWIAYKASGWAAGGASHYPEGMEHSVTFYAAVDKMVNLVMNQTNYPNLRQVVIAGHSMGAQATIRYALMKKPKKYDPSMRYWVGNPGSYPWLRDDFPEEPENPCDPVDQRSSWPYGVKNVSSITKYARKRVDEDPNAIIQQFLGRKVHYALGLLDNGPGDTHCQAQYQGANHLQRGTNFVDMVQQINNGWPSNHSLGFVAGISHQDYPMIVADNSLDFIFGDMDAPRTDRYGLTKEHKPKKPKPPKPQKEPIDYGKVHMFQAIAWVVLAAIIVVLIAGLFIFRRIFTPNTNDWDRDYWESDFKRRLL